MLSCLRRNQEPEEAHEDYVRTLLMVARHGDRYARRLFVQQHADVVGGYAAYLLHLDDGDLEAAFHDAARSRAGVWPKTLMGLRLALPKRLEPQLGDPWKAWRDLEFYEPGGMEIDPVCLMFVDPSDTPYVARNEGHTVYFCCPHCLESWERRRTTSGPELRFLHVQGEAGSRA
jgi:YHS domain-containing protein